MIRKKKGGRTCGRSACGPLASSRRPKARGAPTGARVFALDAHRGRKRSINRSPERTSEPSFHLILSDDLRLAPLHPLFPLEFLRWSHEKKRLLAPMMCRASKLFLWRNPDPEFRTSERSPELRGSVLYLNGGVAAWLAACSQ